MALSYLKLLENNRKWVEDTLQLNPNYFTELAKGQKPEFLWVGCADSRVPANVITGTQSGDIFVHRNIANVVVHTDINCMSVLHYAVDVLKVKHIIVCGHYECGGVAAAMTNHDHGLIINKWLRNIKEVYNRHSDELEAISDMKQRRDRLTELNVIDSVHNLARTSIVQNAWKTHDVKVHGWVYAVENGIIKDLNVTLKEVNDVEPIFRFTE
ncbi:MAG: carbonic anhydrase [Candidatus Kapaibacterium sp.]